MLNKGLASQEPAEGLARPPGESFGGTSASPPPAPAMAAPVLDPAALAQLQRLDPTGANGFLERVLSTFQSSAARLSAKLADARRDDDPKTIRLVVHTLKSSSASIGATTLASVCGAIERAIVAGTRSADLDDDLDAMTATLELTLTAIRQRLGSAR